MRLPTHCPRRSPCWRRRETRHSCSHPVVRDVDNKHVTFTGVAWLCEAAQATMLRWLVTPLFSMARPSQVLVTRPSTTATHMVATLLGSLCCVEWCHVQAEYIIKIITNMSVMFEVHASASAFFKNLLRHYIIMNIC